MKKTHTCSVGKTMLFASLLLVCATFQSCRDEYLLDNQEPEWLGESIYDELQEKGNFKLFLKVIDDLNYKEVLSKTGSKTLFVANDEAFLKGIKEEWGVDSYENLSMAQKRVILFNAMLDNAYLLEMMSNSPALSEKGEPANGECLRQLSSANVVDSVPLFQGDNLPANNEHWDRFRDNNIRVALDGTQTMLLHFLQEQMVNHHITAEDVNILTNKKYGSVSLSDAFIFDKKVIKGDITCKNGYIHELDGLLIPPGNMAEEIRKHPKTSLFSRLLERFSAPVFNQKLTDDYNRIHHYGKPDEAERVYEKRYFTEDSNRGNGGSWMAYTDEDGVERTSQGALSYDPGWNSYRPGLGGVAGVSADKDMGMMLVPTDDVFAEYFLTGEGEPIINRYGHFPNTRENLNANLDSVPLNIAQALVRNLMRPSFNESVPSKFKSIKDDARDPMNVKPESINECIIANNGVVYVMDKIYSPARYVAVTAPAMLDATTKMADWAINYLEYDKYLLSMQSTFSLVIPADTAFVYYDPCTMKEDDPLVYLFKWDDKKEHKTQKLYAEAWTYDKKDPNRTPLKMKKRYTNGKDKGAINGLISNLLKQMLEYYVVVGDFTDGNKYYMSKGYGMVKVETEPKEATANDPSTARVTKIYGGADLQNENPQGIEIGKIYNQKNGKTYRLDKGMIQPPTQSVFDVFSDSVYHSEFSEFFNICQARDEVVELICASITKEDERKKAERKYKIFDGENPNYIGELVRSFNTYHYTVYVPSNDAMQEAYNDGLPKWDELVVDADSIKNWQSVLSDASVDLGNDTTALNNALAAATPDAALIAQLKAKVAAEKAKVEKYTAMVDNGLTNLQRQAGLLVDFAKFHFQDNAVFVDNKRLSIKDNNNNDVYQIRYETALLDTVTNRFARVTVETDEAANTIHVVGDFNRTDGNSANQYDCYVDNSNPLQNEGKLYNIMTRDVERKDAKGQQGIETSSYAVIHLLKHDANNKGYLSNDHLYEAMKNNKK